MNWTYVWVCKYAFQPRFISAHTQTYLFAWYWMRVRNLLEINRLRYNIMKNKMQPCVWQMIDTNKKRPLKIWTECRLLSWHHQNGVLLLLLVCVCVHLLFLLFILIINYVIYRANSRNCCDFTFILAYHLSSIDFALILPDAYEMTTYRQHMWNKIKCYFSIIIVAQSERTFNLAISLVRF